MSNGLSSIGALAYQGTNAPTPPNITTHRNRPTANFYQGFSMGDFWVYRPDPRLNTNELWVLMGVAGNVADWVLLTGSVGSVTDLQTDDGHIVTPTLGIINVLGGTGIVTTGTVGPNTVTISTAGDVATSYITNPATGTAVPSAGVLTFAGTGGAVISAAGSTITVNAGSTGDVTTLHTQDGNNVTATAGVINLSGGNNLTTTGTVGPNTATISLSGITQHSLQVGGAANALTQLGVATNGQLPIGSTGADPVLATLTAGSGITVTNGAGSITINGPAKTASFFVYKGMTSNNVTGDGTVYQITYDTVSFDTGSNFNTGTYKFVAPVTGLYWFYGTANLTVPNTTTNIQFTFVINGSALQNAYDLAGVTPPGPTGYIIGGGVFLSLSATNTVGMQIQTTSGGAPALNASVIGGGISTTTFMGYLVG